MISKRSGKCLHPNAPLNVLLCMGKRRGQVAPPFSVRSFLSLSTDTAGRRALYPPTSAGVASLYVRGVVTGRLGGYFVLRALNVG
jgi:hypothetical protein